MRRVAVLLVLLAASGAAQEQPAECPSGTHRVMTGDQYRPFHCEKDRPSGARLSGSVGPQGFKFRPKCPRGTRAIPDPSGLQQMKCVRTESGETEPELAPLRASEDAGAADAAPADADPMLKGCPPGKRKVRTADPLNPFQCVVQAGRIARLGDEAFRRYSLAREMTFDCPREFKVEDAWKEDIPSLHLSLDDGSPGKPVSLVITKYEPSQTTFQDLDSAIAKDREWQGAKDAGVMSVSGARARVTYVPGETRTAYLPLSKDAYMTIVYSAPVEAFDTYLPAFNRLLKTLKLARASK